MPHDRKGRLVEVGDQVRYPTHAARPDGTFGPQLQIGRVLHVQPAAETCNLTVTYRAYPPAGPEGATSCTAKDAELALKADGSEPVDEVPAAAEPAEPGPEPAPEAAPA